MRAQRISFILAGLMVLASLGGYAARPGTKAGDGTGAPKYVLEQIVPKQFGTWRLLPQTGQIVNPQTKELLDKLYSQVLSRTYVNPQGYQVMLALAYGDDQRGDLQAHKPEVCYPAQGFTLLANDQGPVTTPFGTISARRLNTSKGPHKEPVTYWFTFGETAVKSKFEQRLVEIRLGLTGQVPDGLLFRVSSADDDPARAYRMQDAFVSDLLSAVDARDRTRLSGLRVAAN